MALWAREIYEPRHQEYITYRTFKEIFTSSLSNSLKEKLYVTTSDSPPRGHWRVPGRGRRILYEGIDDMLVEIQYYYYDHPSVEHGGGDEYSIKWKILKFDGKPWGKMSFRRLDDINKSSPIAMYMSYWNKRSTKKKKLQIRINGKLMN
jgi:hypothetical protein